MISNVQELGTPAQIAAALALIGILVRQIVPWHRVTTDAATKLRDELAARNKLLIERVEKCEVECEAHKEELRTEVNKLREERLNDRAQNLQEQIALVSILARNVDSPLLSKILEQLQATKSRLPHMLTGVIGDAKANGK